MIKKLLSLLFLSSLLIASSCQQDKAEEGVWLGGHIVNPTHRYLLLAQGSHIIDTIPLNKNNSFSYSGKNFNGGLYIIRHNETQVFLAEPGDSLMIHLNTIDFDESLAYSGKGSQKNNFLMELFLTNEKENKNLSEWFGLDSENFTRKVDSLKEQKEERLAQFLAEHPGVSEQFEKTARVSITYDSYSKKELYAMANRMRAERLHNTYFTYREAADFNKEEYRFYYPYYRFLNYYFDNIMVASLPSGADRNSYDYNIGKIKAIDSLCKNDSIRNSLSRITALRFLYNSDVDAENQEKFLRLYNKINNNKHYEDEMLRLYTKTSAMSRGSKLPDVDVITLENQVVALGDLIKRPTVLYFWSYNFPDQERINHSRIAELKSKYPEYNFYGINTDSHFRNWRKQVLDKKYDAQKELMFDDATLGKKTLVLNSLSKTIIVDSDKTILSGNANMFQVNFEELLLGYLNR